MVKKYPKSASIISAANAEQGAFIYLDNEDKAVIAKKSALALEECGVFSASASRYNRNFSDLAPNVSGRPGLTRQDYDYFRPNEAVPRKRKAKLRRVNEIYEDNGLVKTVIDLMGDFGCQGIRLSHPNKKIEQFYRNWFKKVKGKERSERFLNSFYRLGVAILTKQTAKISLKVQDQLYKSHAAPDTYLNNLQDVKIEKREIPIRYTFLDPLVVEVYGGALSSFVGTPRYAVVLPDNMRSAILSPTTPEEKAIIAQLPHELRLAAKTNKPYPLPVEKTLVYHYKKDDWKDWATPIIGAIIKNINLLDKLELADSAALDGAISNIRIFTLGSLEHKIIPTAAAVSKLSDALENHPGVGTLDLIWSDDLKLQESKTSVHQFLGSEKYKSTLEAVYAGLGIPPTLVGLGGTGTTNNFISLKTFIERLQYGRDRLVDFWEKEIIEVQKAMGFSEPAYIEFDIMSFANEDAVMGVLVQLVDRNIISHEDIHTFLKRDSKMGKVRVNREEKERKSGKMPPKAGGFHDAQVMEGLRKIALQSGVAAPSEVGLKLEEKRKGEKSGLDFKAEQTAEKKKAGVSGQGRPKGKKDSTTRKTKKFTPKTKAIVELWAQAAQNEIAEILNPALLHYFNKKNMRSLSNDEMEKAENIKFGVLSNMEPLTKISTDNVNAALLKPQDKSMVSAVNEYISSFSLELKRQPTIDEVRQIKAAVYTENIIDYTEGEPNV